MTRRQLARLSAGVLALAWLLAIPIPDGVTCGGESADRLPTPTSEQLPRWRGFNLINKFHREWRNGPFWEEDFRLIHQLGFNFVRLPMDYRVWIQGNDWTAFDETVLVEIDQAVEWGRKHGIHIWINFHRAPGYTVASPPEETNLWTDPEAQRVCALHWAMFARRYRGVPNERLAFNLFNEPTDVDPEVHARVVRRMVEAIRAEDPDRLIIADGLRYGTVPALDLADLGIAQATRGYTPADVTHYRASWVSGADQYPVPTWPRVAASGTLYQPQKSDLKPESRQPLTVHGPFPAAMILRLHVMTVSSRATLAVRGDGRTLYEKRFECGPGEGEWKHAEFMPQWNIYHNTFDRDYEIHVPAGTRRLEVAVTEGDWLRLSEIGLRPAGDEREAVLALRPQWDEQPAQLRYQADPGGGRLLGEPIEDRQWLWERTIVPWQEAQARGIGVMVGEFGCHQHTPHDVVLAWMEDCLANWQQAGWGWALWNLSGAFGVFDSGRQDVDYEDFHGRQLDRQMLELLQRY